MPQIRQTRKSANERGSGNKGAVLTRNGGVLGLDVGGVLGVHLPGLVLLLGDLVLDVDVVAAGPVQLQAGILQHLHLALEQLHAEAFY